VFLTKHKHFSLSRNIIQLFFEVVKPNFNAVQRSRTKVNCALHLWSTKQPKMYSSLVKDFG